MNKEELDKEFTAQYKSLVRYAGRFGGGVLNDFKHDIVADTYIKLLDGTYSKGATAYSNVHNEAWQSYRNFKRARKRIPITAPRLMLHLINGLTFIIPENDVINFSELDLCELLPAGVNTETRVIYKEILDKWFSSLNDKQQRYALELMDGATGYDIAREYGVSHSAPRMTMKHPIQFLKDLYGS